MADMETWEWLLKTIEEFMRNDIVRAALALVIAFILSRIVRAFIRRRIKKSESLTNRAETVLRILSSAVSVVIYFLAILEICRILFHINPATVIAATGVAGVAISFGAQNLVKDMISGFFILLENQYAVGELVTIGEFTGTVCSLGVRSTQLRNVKGDIFIVPNGSVSSVVNHSRGVRGVMVDVEIAYETDINTAIDVLRTAAETAKREMSQLTDVPQVLGVSQLGQSGVKLRILANCETDTQFEVERELLRRMKYALDEKNISIPYNHLVVVNKREE